MTTALPNFRKLYRRIVNTDLTNGKYLVKIDYNYPVLNFEGRKKFVLSTMSWSGKCPCFRPLQVFLLSVLLVLGGKNNFLGISYLVVGSLCISAVAVFSVLVYVKGR